MKAVDVEALAGAWNLGSVREGFDIVRRVALPGGFGNEVIERNREFLGDFPIETGDEAEWTPEHGVSFIFGTPPCSGWSLMNSSTGSAARGADSTIQQCTWGLIRYAARCTGEDGEPGPEIVSFESVQQAFNQGRDLMSAYLDLLRRETGSDYELTHVRMSGSVVGATQFRPRYFWVAHRIPFGVELDAMPDREATIRDAIYDLRGHKLTREKQRYRHAPTGWVLEQQLRSGDDRFSWNEPITNEFENDSRGVAITLHVLATAGDEWKPGEYQRQVLERLWASGELPERAEKWMDMETGKVRGWGGPRRLRWDRAGYVIHGGGPGQFLHPEEIRWLTVRELTRLMGYPDDWEYPETASVSQVGAWIGKNCPVQSGQWMSRWVRRSLEGSPGELRGRPDRDHEGVIDVTHALKGDDRIIAA